MKKYDICIIGGGAAGLAAAASLDEHIKTCLLEKNHMPGRKIMATGGGRCNITNRKCRGKDLTLDFFNALGLETYCDEEGRYFPYSNQARDVVELLTEAVRKAGTDMVMNTRVIGIAPYEDAFRIMGEEGSSFYADNVILASGGKAAPQFGTTGDGYSIAGALGHEIKRLYPVLTAVECGGLSGVKGVRAKGKASLLKDGVKIAEETGEIQFTEDGLSGICIFNLTEYIKAEEDEKFSDALKRFSIVLDLAPDFTYDYLKTRKTSFGILSHKLAPYVPIDEIKKWELPVTGVKGWKHAQCTAGGVSLDEIDLDTMESKLTDGLYFAGEIIDSHGPCGGYNLQNAWETAFKAAKALNDKLR